MDGVVIIIIVQIRGDACPQCHDGWCSNGGRNGKGPARKGGCRGNAQVECHQEAEVFIKQFHGVGFEGIFFFGKRDNEKDVGRWALLFSVMRWWCLCMYSYLGRERHQIMVTTSNRYSILLSNLATSAFFKTHQEDNTVLCCRTLPS